MRDRAIPERIRAEAAWGLVFRHPELFGDPYALGRLSFVSEARTNRYASSKRDLYGCLYDATSHGDVSARAGARRTG